MVDPGSRRRLGDTDVTVSALGLGCAPLGNLYDEVSDADSSATVRGALDAGMRYLDVAPLYGHGLAERRLGKALTGVDRDSCVISTKVGRLIRPAAAAGSAVPDTAASPHRPAPGLEATDGFAIAAEQAPVFDFTADGITTSLAESLDRLGLDRVDVLLIHDPDEHVKDALQHSYPACERLRSEGTVGAIGVGMNSSAVPTRFIAETGIDCVLIAGRYTLLDHSAGEDLLPAAAAAGVSIVIGGVFNSGILVDPSPGARFDYRPAPAQLLARAQTLQRVCRGHDVPLAAAAIQFPFGHPATASVLTGARSAAEVQQNAAAAALPIPTALWRQLVDERLLPAASVEAFGA